MTDSAQAATPAESLDESTLESILENSFGDPQESDDTPAPEQEAQADQDDDPTSDDLDEAEPKPSDDGAAFEIVHNGQTVKLSRDEVIENARKGFDYTQKTMDLANQRAEVQQIIQRAAQVEQLAPYVAQDLATVKAFESQLQQYSKVDWVALATNDPLEYPKYRAQYDQLVQGYQGAVAQYQERAGAVLQERRNLTAYTLQQEAAKLTERIPEWRDPEKFKAGATELRAYLIKQGANAQEVDSLSDSLAVSIARKAMLYDKLVDQKAAKTKQLRAAPPVVRPGAAPASDQGKANFAKAQTAIRQAGRQGQHRTQEQIMVGLLNRTFKK